MVVVAWVVVDLVVVNEVVSVVVEGHVYSGHGHPLSHPSWHGHFRVSDKNSLTKFDPYWFIVITFKGVAQPYLSLLDSFWELQKSDRSETFSDGRADWVGDFVFFQILKIILSSEAIANLVPKMAEKDGFI